MPCNLLSNYVSSYCMLFDKRLHGTKLLHENHALSLWAKDLAKRLDTCQVLPAGIRGA